MGSGQYSFSSRTVRAKNLGYDHKPKEEIFKSRSIPKSMDPRKALLRESRDSKEHPESVAIMLGLDVTGSMGEVPHYIVQKGLPDIIQKIINNGILHPQILFAGIGDHYCDDAPFQVGQYESSDELLDKWLTEIWLESGGGGNGGESYLLAWWFAAYRTAIDCFEKRNQKGVLITVGDEPLHRSIGSDALKRIMGQGEFKECTASELLEKAQEKYHVYHINIVGETSQGDSRKTKESWQQALGHHFFEVQNKKAVIEQISGIIISCFEKSSASEEKQQTIEENKKEEMIL